MNTLVWQGCYDESWKGIIPDAAFEHPAKFSKRLVERILKHMEERGWIQKGDMIADPFGGVRLGGVVCAYHGYRWVGVELEQRFMALGEQVFDLHRERWDRLGVPQPVCVQGDSRRFHEIIADAAAVMSSPPYVSGGHHNDVFEAWNTNGRGQNGRGDLHGYGKTEGQIAQLKEGSLPAVVSSPPYADSFDGQSDNRERQEKLRTVNPKLGRFDKSPRTYGKSDGQIGTCKQGDLGAVVTSVPFQRAHGGEKGIMVDGYKGKKGRRDKNLPKRQMRDGERAEGNIEDTKHGSVDVVMSSPPYEDSVNSERHGFDFNKGEWQKHDPVTPGRLRARERNHTNRKYGDTEGQIGKLKKQTYWEAMLKVYSSCYLAPARIQNGARRPATD